MLEVCGNAVAVLGTVSGTCTGGPGAASPVSLCGNAIAVLGTAVAGCSTAPAGEGQGVAICGNAITVLGTAAASCSPGAQQGTTLCGNAVAVLGTATAACREPVARPIAETPAPAVRQVSWSAPAAAGIEPWKPKPERPRLYGRHSGWTPARPSSAGSAPGAPERGAWVISPIGGALPIPGGPVGGR
ncbi:hypothetical protein [Actinocorallia herbida]|uniref:hypothetical protein n=1 Tax=Actinocorallia herbida TaxID=58109 RepID=UPI000F4C180A|nr:hypothetical protein [Actinocorallia herbida]